MNGIAIILAIVVILLFYILYRFFMLKSTELSSTASLLDSNPSIPIVNKPTSTRYSYGIWIYVNSWDSSIEKTIFERKNNIKLYFSATAPVLKCDITMNNGSTTASSTTLEITDNFPLQKWVHIVTSVDNQYLDAYLDGKLVKSGRLYTESVKAVAATSTVTAVTAVAESTPKTPGDEPIVIGSGTTYDAYIAKFNHWALPLDPQTVWSTYSEGNGQSGMNNYISSYGIDLSILKDNVEQSKYSLL
tara:strand:- start:1479 stop:2216 length:738 start_codon:yes stop_codon:yes gene_type:complete